jgi:hypothetical protein
VSILEKTTQNKYSNLYIYYNTKQMGVLMENELDDDVMEIKALENEFAVIYKQYQQAHQNYNNAYKNWLNGNKQYIKLASMTSTGGIVRDTKPSNSVDECVALCSADNCGYATFSQQNKNCKIMGGNFLPEQGTSDQTGIIPDVLFWALQVDHFNMSLIALSEKILYEFDKVKPIYESQVTEKNQKKEQLKNVWNNLVAERDKLKTLIEEYNSLSENNKNQTLNTNHQNAAFKVWAFLAIILVLFFLKEFTDVDLSTNTIIIIISAITFIALSFNLSTIAGFFVWLVILLLVVMLYPMFNNSTP